MKFYKIGSTMYKLREYKNSHIPDSFSAVSDIHINEQTRQLVSMRDHLVRQQEEARPVRTGTDSLTLQTDVSSPGS